MKTTNVYPRMLPVTGAGEATFQDLFNHHPIPTWVYDLKTLDFLEVNNIAVEKYGYSRREFLGMTLKEIYRSEDIPRLLNAIGHGTSELRHSGRWHHLLKDGRIIDVEVTSDMVYYNGRDAVVAIAVDIIGRKRAGARRNTRDIIDGRIIEESLRESEERYRRLFETAQDGILLLDAESGAITDANPFLQDMLGYSPEDLIGKRLWEIGAFVDVAANKAAFEKLQRQEYIRYENLPLQTKDGQSRHVEFVSNVYPVNGTKVIQCNIRDITERRRAGEALLDSEVRYRRLFETAKDGILILDAVSGMIVDVNPFLIEMLGYSHEQFIGKTIWELGFMKDLVANRENYLELQQKGYVRYEDMPLQAADGRRIDVEFVSNVYEVDHQRVVQCNIRDITERKRGEKELIRLRLGIERSSEAIFMTDIRGVIQYVNPAFEQIYGYQSDEAIGKTPRILKSSEQTPSVYAELWNNLLSKKAFSAEFIN